MADKSAGQEQGGTPRDESSMASDVAGAVRAHPLAAGAAALAAGGLAIAALVQGKKNAAKAAKAPARKKAAPARKPGAAEAVAADTAKPRKTAAKSADAPKPRKSAAKTADSGAAKPRKTAAKSASGGAEGKPRGGLAQPVQPDEMLAAVVGDKAAPRSEMTKRLWDYIKKNDLQDPENRRMINADDKLRPIFGTEQVSMFEMTKLVNKHMSAQD